MCAKRTLARTENSQLKCLHTMCTHTHTHTHTQTANTETRTHAHTHTNDCTHTHIRHECAHPHLAHTHTHTRTHTHAHIRTHTHTLSSHHLGHTDIDIESVNRRGRNEGGKANFAVNSSSVVTRHLTNRGTPPCVRRHHVFCGSFSPTSTWVHFL